MVALIRWKLPLHGAPTTGTTTLTSAGGSSQPLPGRARRCALQRDQRPPRHRRHRLPRRRPLRPAPRAAQRWWATFGRAGARHRPARPGDRPPRDRAPSGSTAPMRGRADGGRRRRPPPRCRCRSRRWSGSRWRGVGARDHRRGGRLRHRGPRCGDRGCCACASRVGGAAAAAPRRTFPLKVQAGTSPSRAPPTRGRGRPDTDLPRPGATASSATCCQVLQQRRGGRCRTVGSEAAARAPRRRLPRPLRARQRRPRTASTWWRSATARPCAARRRGVRLLRRQPAAAAAPARRRRR